MTYAIAYYMPVLIGIGILVSTFRTVPTPSQPVKRHLYIVDCIVSAPHGNERISVAVVATDEWYAHYGARCNVSRRNYVFVDSDGIRKIA